MDKLKKELEERKRKVAEEKAAASAGSKYMRRGDIEKIQVRAAHATCRLLMRAGRQS